MRLTSTNNKGNNQMKQLAVVIMLALAAVSINLTTFAQEGGFVCVPSPDTGGGTPDTTTCGTRAAGCPGSCTRRNSTCNLCVVGNTVCGVPPAGTTCSYWTETCLCTTGWIYGCNCVTGFGVFWTTVPGSTITGNQDCV